MKLNTRQLQQEDLDTIRKWWEAWPDWVDPGEGFLPKTGLVVTSNDKLIMASFVYLTNADVALYEWIISDPDYREEDRQEAIELMTIEAEKMAVEALELMENRDSQISVLPVLDNQKLIGIVRIHDLLNSVN